MDTKRQKFGDWIRQWRKEVRLTQQELADRAGITKSYISNLERNSTHTVTNAPARPRIEIVDKIAKALGRPAQEAREVAGYGIKDVSTTAAISTGKPALPRPDGMSTIEDLLVFYFRRLRPEQQPQAIAYLASLFQQAQAAGPDPDDDIIGAELEIVGFASKDPSAN